MATDTKFEVLSPEEAAMVRAMRDGRMKLGITEALIGGETLWVPHRKVSNYYPMARNRGYQLRVRYAERDGVKGCYVWAEKAEALQTEVTK